MSAMPTNNTDFSLAPGEKAVFGERFLASLAAPYLKAQVMCSSTRFVYKAPNTLLGVIPLGYQENTMPISHLAQVSTNVQFKFGRFLLAVILILVGLASFNSSVIMGIICLLFGVVSLLTAFPAVLSVSNPAGGTTNIFVSSLEKAKLEKFKAELQARVFADQEETRHNEAQQLRMQQTMLQQMQLQQMQNQNQQSRGDAQQ